LGFCSQQKSRINFVQSRGMKTIEPKVEYSCKHGRSVGQREELSEEDVQKINAHYRCRNTVTKKPLIVTERPRGSKKSSNACSPSPCGPNSQCIPIKMQEDPRERSRRRTRGRSREEETVEVASCSCAAGHIGKVPNCIPAKDCGKDRECRRSRACQMECERFMAGAR